MNNYYTSDFPNLNYTNLQMNSYSYSNIFNVPNLKTMNNLNNNLNYLNPQNTSYLIKNNSTFFTMNNDYYNSANNSSNNNNNKININQIYSKDNQSPSHNINQIYQNNNLSSNSFIKNGNIYYTPSKLANSKNMVLYNYNSLKYNNSYQNLTNRTNTSNNTINLQNNYNMNSNNSASTNTKSNYSINNKLNTIPNLFVQKHISQPNINKPLNRVQKLKISKKNSEVQEKNKNIIKQIYSSEPKDHFDPSEFKVIKRIGEGSYGKIYIVQWVKNNKKYAMKKEPIKTNQIINRKKEKIKLMNDFITKTKCPGIIRTYGNSIKKEKTEQEYYYYILMELAEKDWEKEISDRKKLGIYYTEKELLIIMQQLITTLSLLQKII